MESMVGIVPEETNITVWIATKEEVEKHDRLVVENPHVSNNC